MAIRYSLMLRTQVEHSAIAIAATGATLLFAKSCENMRPFVCGRQQLLSMCAVPWMYILHNSGCQLCAVPFGVGSESPPSHAHSCNASTYYDVRLYAANHLCRFLAPRSMHPTTSERLFHPTTPTPSRRLQPRSSQATRALPYVCCGKQQCTQCPFS